LKILEEYEDFSRIIKFWGIFEGFRRTYDCDKIFEEYEDI
jgi:hypothetical protein